MTSLRHLGLLAVALHFAACSASAGTTGNGGRHDAGSGGGGDMDGGGMAHVDSGRTPPGVDGGHTPGVDAYVDRMTYCMGGGPPVRVGDTTMPMATCAGAIASRVFSSSMCTCTDANIAGYLKTRSFHSRTATMETFSGAPVGVNDHYTTGGYADVGGTFTIAGSSGVRFIGYLKVGGDFKSGGNVDATGVIQIKRDAWVDGNLSGFSLVEIDRDFYQTSGHSASVFTRVDGDRHGDPFTVPEPCHCGADELVNIDGIVRQAELMNDNAEVHLDPRSLENVVGLGVDITLPCGRFYVTSIGGLGTITLHVTGRTALFVGGDVRALGSLEIDLAPEAEIDIFIAGDLLSIGAGDYGETSRPAATRIYVGGSGDVTLVGASRFIGNVYAPHSRITAPGATTVYGSLFGRQIDIPGYLDIHYDRAILDAGRDCPMTPGEDCGICTGSCSGGARACIAGECAACRSDADCCAPLICYADGSCGALVI